MKRGPRRTESVGARVPPARPSVQKKRTLLNQPNIDCTITSLLSSSSSSHFFVRLWWCKGPGMKLCTQNSKAGLVFPLVSLLPSIIEENWTFGSWP